MFLQGIILPMTRGNQQRMVEKNIEKFKELGVKKIVTLSPHCKNQGEGCL